MSEGEMATRRRAVRGLPQPPGALGAPAEQGQEGARTAETRSPQPPEREEGRPGGGEGRVAPARSARRDPHTFRLYRDLFAELSRLVRELEDRGVKTDRTELLHALLYYDLPATGETAERLIRRWRKLQAGA